MDAQTSSEDDRRKHLRCDVDRLRVKVQRFLRFRQPRSAVYWAEKLVTISSPLGIGSRGAGHTGEGRRQRVDEGDVYLYAHSLECNGEYRAALQIVENYGMLEKPPPRQCGTEEVRRVSFRLLCARCLHATGQYQRCVELLDSGYLNAAIAGAEGPDGASGGEVEGGGAAEADELRDLLSCCCLVLARCYNQLESNQLALQWYSRAVRLDKFCFEAVETIADNFMEKNEMLYDMIDCGDEKSITMDTASNGSDPTGGVRRESHKGLDPMHGTRSAAAAAAANVAPTHQRSSKDASADGDSFVKLLMRCKVSSQDAAAGLNELMGEIERVVPTSESAPMADGEHGNLIHSSDVVACRAQWLYSRGHFSECYALTSASLTPPIADQTAFSYKQFDSSALAARLPSSSFSEHWGAAALSVPNRGLGLGSSSTPLLLLHIGCLCELKYKNELFLLAHRLVEDNSQSPVSWYAVGSYYMAIGNHASARRHYSKSTTLDPRFIASWVGFAHSFAAQDESDQAMAAYRTAARLFPGSHAPLLAMGVEYGRTGNYVLAHQSLMQAQDIMPGDPAVYNELAVVQFRSKDYRAAAHWIGECLRRLPEVPSVAWVAVAINMAHIQRKLGNYGKAVDWYEHALMLTPKDHQIFSSLGFTHHLMGGRHLSIAIEYYHKALALAPQDNHVSELLECALAEDVRRGFS